MRFSPTSSFVVSDRALSQEVSGETVLLDLASEKYFGLDPVGTRIWQLLSASRTPGEILATLEQEFDAGREQLERDLESFLDALLQAGLIRAREGLPG